MLIIGDLRDTSAIDKTSEAVTKETNLLTKTRSVFLWVKRNVVQVHVDPREPVDVSKMHTRNGEMTFRQASVTSFCPSESVKGKFLLTDY